MGFDLLKDVVEPAVGAIAGPLQDVTSAIFGSNDPKTGAWKPGLLQDPTTQALLTGAASLALGPEAGLVAGAALKGMSQASQSGGDMGKVLDAAAGEASQLASADPTLGHLVAQTHSFLGKAIPAAAMSSIVADAKKGSPQAKQTLAGVLGGAALGDPTSQAVATMAQNALDMQNAAEAKHPAAPAPSSSSSAIPIAAAGLGALALLLLL